MANPTIGNNILFGRGTLANKPSGTAYPDMLYFATDIAAIFLGDNKVSSGLLDVEYKSVTAEEGVQFDITGYTGLSASASGPIINKNGTTYLEMGSYILVKKLIWKEVEGKHEPQWSIIVLSSSVTPEALQTELNSLGTNVDGLHDDVSTLEEKTNQLDSSLKATDTKVDNLTNKVEQVVIPDVEGLHTDVSALHVDVSTLQSSVDTIETILDSTNKTVSTRLDTMEARYVKVVSAGSGINVSTAESSTGKTVTVSINTGSGLKVADGSIGINMDDSVFEGLGSYTIVSVPDSGGLQYKLQKAGVDVPDSVINIPKDQFLKDVTILTPSEGANAGKQVIRFEWELTADTEEKKHATTDILLSSIFPGIAGTSGEINVNPAADGTLKVSIDNALKEKINKIDEIDNDLSDLTDVVSELPEYVGSENGSSKITVEPGTGSNAGKKVITASLNWLQF